MNKTLKNFVEDVGFDPADRRLVNWKITEQSHYELMRGHCEGGRSGSVKNF